MAVQKNPRWLPDLHNRLDCFASLAMTRFKREACSPVASLKSVRDFIETTGLPTLRFGRSHFPPLRHCETRSVVAVQKNPRWLPDLHNRLDCFASLAMTRFTREGFLIKRPVCRPSVWAGASLKSVRDFIETTGLPT